MDWLRTIDADALEDVVNDLLAEHADDPRPDRSRIVIISSITLSRIVSHPSTRSLFDEASRRNHQLSPLLYRVRPRYEKPLTLAITPVVSDEDAADAVGRVLDRVEQLPFEVDAILADRGYYQSASFDVLGPLLRWFSRSSKGKTASPSTRHTPPTGPNMRCTRAKTESFSSRTRSVSPTTTATAARTAKSSVDMACDLTDRTPKQVETLYRKRSAIETSYRTYREARATTTTPDPLIRFVLVAVGFLLRNLWLVVRWTVVARPRRGGRDLPTNSRSNWCVAGSEPSEHRDGGTRGRLTSWSTARLRLMARPKSAPLAPTRATALD